MNGLPAMWGLVLLLRQGWKALGRSAAPQAVVVEDRVDDAREARLVLDAPRRRAVPEVDEIAAHEADLADEVVVPDVVLGGKRTASLGVPCAWCVERRPYDRVVVRQVDEHRVQVQPLALGDEQLELMVVVGVALLEHRVASREPVPEQRPLSRVAEHVAAGETVLRVARQDGAVGLSLIHISEPTRLGMISYAV